MRMIRPRREPRGTASRRDIGLPRPGRDQIDRLTDGLDGLDVEVAQLDAELVVDDLRELGEVERVDVDLIPGVVGAISVSTPNSVSAAAIRYSITSRVGMDLVIALLRGWRSIRRGLRRR